MIGKATRAMAKLPVTVVIPVKNEEKNLPLCLERLGDFTRLWVVDSGSTDATREIALAHGARLIDFQWGGGFPKKRNWVLLNERFDTEWVLFLDADEHVSDAFVAEARAAIERGGHAGFWLNYTTHFMGRVLAHGVPQRKLALFRVGVGLYEQIEDPGWSQLDMEVHEHPVLDGSIGEIIAPIDHLDYRGIEHFIARHNAYSTWEASRYAELVRGGADAWKRLTPRQRRKYRHLAKWWFAPAYFLTTYLLKRGFLDGAAGLHYAFLKMAYFQNIKLKIDEQARS